MYPPYAAGASRSFAFFSNEHGLVNLSHPNLEFHIRGSTWVDSFFPENKSILELFAVPVTYMHSVSSAGVINPKSFDVVQKTKF
jgi:hypothetical protein